MNIEVPPPVNTGVDTSVDHGVENECVGDIIPHFGGDGCDGGPEDEVGT